MTRFALGGDEDGEGPSSPTALRSSKRRRRVPSRRISSQQASGSDDDDTVGQQVLGSASSSGNTVTVGQDSPAATTAAADDDSNIKPISISLTDSDAFDCPICCETLTVPVFQCENGHIACSTCATKINNKCPCCSFPIGYNRCRAIERILESIKITCPHLNYGCTQKMLCSNRKDHEKSCAFNPCACPLSGCDFVHSSYKLYLHFKASHPTSAVRFRYRATFSVPIDLTDNIRVLQEENDGVLFVLENQSEILGNMFQLTCIQPSFIDGFFYELTVSTKGCSLRLQSITKSSRCHIPCASSGSFIIPSDFFTPGTQPNLYICIWRSGQKPPSFQI